MALYVRTGNGGADPDFLIGDLGFIIITGATWKSLSYSDNLGPGGGLGQFTDTELKNSFDLFDAIFAGDLEWSTDGAAQRTDPFDADIALVINLSNNDFNLTDGYLVLPNRTGPPPIARPGEIYYDTNDGYVSFYDGYQTRYISLIEAGVPSVVDHGNLTGLTDDDHSQYPLLTGNSSRNNITGTFNFADGYLTLPVDAFAPIINVVSGAATVVAGILYIYDASRAKWLSVHRDKYVSNRNAAASTNIYLRIGEGTPSNTTGIRMTRNGTITSLAAQTDTAETWIFEVRKNDVLSSITSLSISAAIGSQNNTINIDVSQGDELQFFCNGSGINHPVGIVEVAWRI